MDRLLFSYLDRFSGEASRDWVARAKMGVIFADLAIERPEKTTTE
jgi:hypothetical protein